MKLPFRAFAWIALAVCTPLLGKDKIDKAIDLSKANLRPVFVRMIDQLIARAGEYESSAGNALASHDHKTARKFFLCSG